MADYVENFNNPQRRDSSLNDLTAIEYDELNETQTVLA
jgi:hypothetical protein